MKDIKIKVTVLITDKKDERVLLIKEKITKKPVPLWNVIKGTYGDSGEETILEAAKRECREEAGIEVELTNLINVSVAKKDEDLRVQFNFLGEANNENSSLSSEEEQKQRSEEISEIKWFSKEEAKKIPPEEFISKRAYDILQDWIEEKKYPIEMIKFIKE